MVKLHGGHEVYQFHRLLRVKDVGLYRPVHHWVFGGGASLDPPAPRPERQRPDEVS